MLMSPVLTGNLLTLAQAYMNSMPGALSVLSKRAHSDSAFFERLEAGQISFSVRKYDEIVCWFSENWPLDTVWPADVERPEAWEIRAVIEEKERANGEKAKRGGKKAAAKKRTGTAGKGVRAGR